MSHQEDAVHATHYQRGNLRAMLDEYVQSAHEILDTVEYILDTVTKGTGDTNLAASIIKFLNLIYDIRTRTKSCLVIIG